MTTQKLALPQEKIAQFCQRWRIVELALFGSALRDDFTPDSDVDLLVTFAPDAQWGLFDHVQMEQELMELLNRKVDLLTRRAVEHSHNRIRRREILNNAETVYAT